VERILADGQDADVLALPSDHWVPEAERFWAAVETGREVLRRGLPVVTFGVRPGYAEPGYGYVERGTPIDGCAGAFRAARFHEKPDAEQAERYVADGRCSWNSGIFLFRAGSMADLLRRHVVELAAPLDRLREAMQARRAAGAGMPSPEEWRRYFEDAPSVSIDHGVMERAAEVALVEAEFEWSDLGNWISLADKLRDDGGGNRARGETLALDSEGCVLFSDDGGLLAVLGVKDLIVVRAADATLVCPRDRAQEVRRLVRQGKADARLGRYF
jgi:mannose-1-phosphate guanylyltransferase